VKRSAIGGLVLGLAAIMPAQAIEVGGTTVPDRLTLTESKQPLVLNGAGIRKKFFIRVYVGALYLDVPATDAGRILSSAGPRVMRLHFVRDVDQEASARAWTDAIRANHSPDEVRMLDARLATFRKLMPAVRRGDILRVDMLPNGATRLVVNDQPRGTIEGADFQRALLRAWIGAHPADTDLKQSVLSGGKQ